MSSSSRCGIAVLLRIGPQLSCQLGKSFRNNVIALAALCQMSDIVENPTTSAPPNHRINLRRQSVTPHSSVFPGDGVDINAVPHRTRLLALRPYVTAAPRFGFNLKDYGVLFAEKIGLFVARAAEPKELFWVADTGMSILRPCVLRQAWWLLQPESRRGDRIVICAAKCGR
jgi:hypothetical protein